MYNSCDLAPSTHLEGLSVSLILLLMPSCTGVLLALAAAGASAAAEPFPSAPSVCRIRAIQAVEKYSQVEIKCDVFVLCNQDIGSCLHVADVIKVPISMVVRILKLRHETG